MPDPDVLRGAIAARLRLLDDVATLYPPQRGAAQAAASLAGLLDRVADDPTVDVSPDGGTVEASIGVSGVEPAPATALRAIAEVRAAAPEVVRVRIRIASVG